MFAQYHSCDHPVRYCYRAPRVVILRPKKKKKGNDWIADPLKQKAANVLIRIHISHSVFNNWTLVQCQQCAHVSVLNLLCCQKRLEASAQNPSEERSKRRCIGKLSFFAIEFSWCLYSGMRGSLLIGSVVSISVSLSLSAIERLPKAYDRETEE